MTDIKLTRDVVAISGTFTVDPLLAPLNHLIAEAGLPLDVESAPYNQVFQQLLTPSSLLARNTTGINVVLLRPEDFVANLPAPDEAAAMVARTARELEQAFAQYCRRTKNPTIVALLPGPQEGSAVLQSALGAARRELQAAFADQPNVYLLDGAAIDALAGADRFDPIRGELAHIPFTEPYYAALAIVLVRKLHALRVAPHKVLVLDCDNTLWGGVVGEDGVAGISLSPAFLALQRFAVEQQRKGTLICLASKNAERDVLAVFAAHPEMPLTLDHVVAHRINWQPKAENIASLARELNLGLDAFVFLDDNPVECAQVRAALPPVVTLQTPVEAEIPGFLENLWLFDKLNVTSEDLRRTNLYRENAARQQLEDSATDIAEFLASLAIVIDIAEASEGEWARIAQLTHRTNQFNFTTIRRSEAELRALAGAGAWIHRVSVRDRFGDYGIVGVMVSKPNGDALVVDTLLLSCRVLGRGVEHAMLRRLGDIAAQRSLAHVALPYVATAKNEPAIAFALSVAAPFRHEESVRVVFRIPTAQARLIEHRPGHDPDAVVNARKADARKGAVVAAGAGAASVGNRSQRYAKLAQICASGPALLAEVRRAHAHVRTLPTQLRQPESDTERRLVELWRELLNIDEIGVDDDYFDLGGTSLLAARMFAEIARRFGKKLRLTTILDCPTVRALAPYVEPAGLSVSGAIVELRRAGALKLFLIHDGLGETLLYRNLVARLPDAVSAYGVEPHRLPGIPLAHTRIEDMAAHYLVEIRKLQPKGPYLLGGLCAGAVIAFEMALQLERTHEPVALVAMFDAARPHAAKRAGRVRSQRAQNLGQIFSKARDQRSKLGRVLFIGKSTFGKALNLARWLIASRVEQVSVGLRFKLLDRLLERRQPWPAYLPELTVQQIYDRAEARYHPGRSTGSPMLLARALRGDPGVENDAPYREIYSDEALGWRDVAPSLSIVDVSGGHSSMLQEPAVDSLAAVLSSTLFGTAAEATVRAATVDAKAPPAPKAAAKSTAALDSRAANF
jgi:FkbH-like protein